MEKEIKDLIAATGGHIAYMSVRDYFAAQAMTGILAHGYPVTRKEEAAARIAIAAYQMADAMLEARVK